MRRPKGPTKYLKLTAKVLTRTVEPLMMMMTMMRLYSEAKEFFLWPLCPD
jgi:hypothetical protein